MGNAGVAVRVIGGMINAREGDLVDVTGVVGRNDPPYDEEVVVRVTDVLPTGHVLPLLPYGSCGRSLGGGVYGCQPGLFDSTRPITSSYGLNVVGMLVKAWGTAIKSPGPVGCFWIDDGSQLYDGTAAGIRVYTGASGSATPPPGYCSVTGVMRCIVVEPGSYNVRVIWPRRSTDIVHYDP